MIDPVAFDPVALQRHNDIISAGSRVGYQAFVFAAALAGGWLIRQDSAGWALPRAQRWTILAVAFAGAMIGSAIPAYFAGGLIEDLAWTVPISPKTVMGGLLLSYLFVVIYKKASANRADTSDAFALGAVAMMAIGRIGCIFQHCCYGRQAAWGFDFGDHVPRVPVQYFEAAGLFALFFLVRYLQRGNLFPGRRLFIVFALYGLMRFGLEFWREPIAAEYFGIGFYQLIALAIFLVGAIEFFRRTALLSSAIAVKSESA